MPTYDYRCEANGQIVEVKHRMSETVQTWGELCQLAGIEPGDTEPASPVSRLATGGNVVKSGGGRGMEPACASGPCCGGGMCGLPE
jgi:hypothetical protein